MTRTFGTSGSRIVSVRATDNAGVATIAFRTIEVTGSTSGSTQGQSGDVTAAGGSPTSSASSAKKLAMLTPFPIVRIRGVILRGFARLSLLSVKAPKGARVKVICHGGGCPKKKSVVLRVAAGKSSCACGASNGGCAGARSSRCSSPPPGERQVHEVHDPLERRAGPSRSLPAAGQVEARLVPGLIVLAAQLGEQELRVHRADEVT